MAPNHLIICLMMCWLVDKEFRLSKQGTGGDITRLQDFSEVCLGHGGLTLQ